jgi:hypothetical protein
MARIGFLPDSDPRFLHPRRYAPHKSLPTADARPSFREASPIALPCYLVVVNCVRLLRKGIHCEAFWQDTAFEKN